MRHDKPSLGIAPGQLGHLHRRALRMRSRAVRAVVGVVIDRPVLFEGGLHHGIGPRVGRVLADPELQSPEPLGIPAIHLLDRVVGVHRVDVAKRNDPIPDPIPHPGGGLVARLDLRRIGRAVSPEIAQKRHRVQSEAIQVPGQIVRLAEQAPVVHVRIHDAESPQCLHPFRMSDAGCRSVLFFACNPKSALRTPQSRKDLPCGAT